MTDYPAPAPTTLVVDAMPLVETEEAPQPPPVQEKSVAHYLLLGIAKALAKPRVLLFLWLWGFLLALLVAAPVFSSAASHLQSVGTSSHFDFVDEVPAWIVDEWRRVDPRAWASVGPNLALLLLLVSLANLLWTAGWMRIATDSAPGHSLRNFFAGGGRYFYPFLRTWLFGCACYAGLSYVFWGPPAIWFFHWFVPGGDLNLAASESTTFWLKVVQQLFYFLALWVVEIWLDVARASLICGQRRSATLALIRGLGFVLRRPSPLFGFMALGFGLELLWIATMDALRTTFDWSLLFLVLVVPFGRLVLRGARYIGLIQYYAAQTADGSQVEES